MRPAPLAAAVLAALVLLQAACGGGDGGGGGQGDTPTSGATCPAGSTLTAASFGTAFLTTYCTGCHGTPPSGGAPSHADFTGITIVRDHLGPIDRRAAAGPARTNTAMPPLGYPAPTLAERQQLGEWLACGAP